MIQRNHDAVNTTSAIDFLSAVFPCEGENYDGHILIWTLDRSTNAKVSYWAGSPHEADGLIKRHAPEWQEVDVYIGMGVSAPDAVKGRDLRPGLRLKDPSLPGRNAPFVHFLPGLWADVDTVEGHEGKGRGLVYAPSKEYILDRLPSLPIQPTVVVDSGHELQLFWVWEEGLLDISGDPAAARRRQEEWTKLIREWAVPHAIDSTVDLARVMRLPGFLNHKKSPVAETRICFLNGPRTTPGAVDALLSARPVAEESWRRPTSTPPVDQLSDFTPMMLFSALENDPNFRRTWTGDRADLEDQSASGYDMAIAHLAVGLEWSHSQIVSVIQHRRRQAGAKDKSAEYYNRTAQKALDIRCSGREATHTDRDEPGRSTTDTVQDRQILLWEAPAAPESLGDWYQFGRWVGQVLEPEYRYDERRKLWYRWQGTHWTAVDSKVPESIQDMLRSQRDPLDYRLVGLSKKFTPPPKKGEVPIPKRVLTFSESNLNGNLNLGIGAGIRRAVLNNFPNWARDQGARETRQATIAVPSGTVDLRTGILVPHHSATSNATGTTLGDYRPDELSRLHEVLRDRTRVIWDDQQHDVFLHFLGLTMSGKGQSHRSIILCQGGSGHGKGGVIRLVSTALGDRAAALPPALLEKTMQEIDATRYSIIFTQPLMLTLDESHSVRMATLLSLTGDNILPPAREPYMLTALSDTIPSVIWWSVVDTPAMDVKAGAERRLGYLPFPNKIPDHMRDTRQFYSHHLLDAVVTVGIAEAIKCWEPNWSPPMSNAPEDVMAEMDPVQGFLAGLDDSWNGKPVCEAREAFSSQTGTEISVTKFGLCVNKSERWQKQKATTGPHKDKQILQRIRT